MTPEGKVKRWASDYLKRELVPCKLYRPPGGPFGTAGEPDLHVTYGGCKGVIEAKVEYGEPTPLQQARMREYVAAGALGMFLRGRDERKLALFVKLMKERAECLKLIIGQQSQA